MVDDIIPPWRRDFDASRDPNAAANSLHLRGDHIAPGTITTTNLANNSVTNPILRDSGALSVIGRSVNSLGDPADISAVAASDAVLREFGSTVGFGQIATAGIANNAVDNTKIRDSGALSVIGRSANSSGDPADISATAATGAVLRESGSTIGFGTIATAGIADDAVTTLKVASSARGYGQQGMVNGTLNVSAASSALTIALKTLAGTDPSATDPVDFFFRNATGTTGDYVRIRQTAASSIVVSSGSTLGVVSSKGFRVWVVAFNDAGTLRLGVIQCAIRTAGSEQVFPLVEGLASSTAEGGAGAADSAGTIYTGSAVSSKAMLIIGYAEWNATGLTAGTWTTTNLSVVQLYGPGIRNPGDVVQKITAVSSPNNTTTSTTFVVSSQTLSITPTSAANVIEAGIHTTTYMNTAAAGNICFSQMSRGNTANTNMIGSLGVSAAGSQTANTQTTLWALDTPNTTSSQIYAGQFRSNVGTATAAYGGSLAAIMTLSEIMS